MSDQPNSVSMPTAPAKPAPALDTRSLTVTYSNYFRSSASDSEVILDFGLHAYHQDANGPEPIQLTHRLVLSWNTARALCRGLHHLLQQHEQASAPLASDAARRPLAPPPA
jgi:hypothetical protein